MGKIRKITNLNRVKEGKPHKDKKRLKLPLFIPMVSNCCGAVSSGEVVDIGLCPECLEPCEYLEDSEPIELINKELT